MLDSNHQKKKKSCTLLCRALRGTMKHFSARFDRGSMMRTQGDRRCSIVRSSTSWVTEQRVGAELADIWLCNDTPRREMLSSPNKRIESVDVVETTPRC